MYDMKYINSKYKVPYFIAGIINSSDLEVLYYYMDNPKFMWYIISDNGCLKEICVSNEKYKSLSKSSVFFSTISDLASIMKYNLNILWSEENYEELYEELNDAGKQFVDDLYTAYEKCLTLENLK